VEPQSSYGRTKLAGERNVVAALPSTLLLRTSANFGWNLHRGKTNAVTWILEKLRRGEPAPLFTDSGSRRPTFPRWPGSPSTCWIATRHGIFHVSSKDCLNRLEIGKAVCKTFGFSEDSSSRQDSRTCT